MPGREREYEANKSQGGVDGMGGPAHVPPPIDAERRSRSPGLNKNFYDVSTSDFKRPYGFGRGATPTLDEPLAAGVEAAATRETPADAAPADAAPAGARTQNGTAAWMGQTLQAVVKTGDLQARVERLERSNEQLEWAITQVMEQRKQ